METINIRKTKIARYALESFVYDIMFEMCAREGCFFSLLGMKYSNPRIYYCREGIIEDILDEFYDKNTLKHVRLNFITNDKKLILPAKDLINQFEEAIGFSKTIFKKVDFSKEINWKYHDNGEEPNLIHLSNNYNWFHSPVLLSLYMLLIRGASNYHNVGQDFNTTLEIFASKRNSDSKLFAKAYDFVKLLLKVGTYPFFYTQMKSNYNKLDDEVGCQMGISTFAKIIYNEPSYNTIKELSNIYSKEELRKYLIQNKNFCIRNVFKNLDLMDYE